MNSPTGKDVLISAKNSKADAAFWWLGQHSFIVKLGKKVILIDPYLKPSEKRNIPPFFAPEDAIGLVDMVFCTHDHSDHIDPFAITGLAKSEDILFLAPTAHRNRMLTLGVQPERLKTINHSEDVAFDEIKVHAIKCAHERFDETADGLFPHLGYVVSWKDKNLYHAGDTLWWEGLQGYLSKWPLNVAMVPINGRDAERFARNCLGNMTFQEAADLVGGLKVKLSVPTHYDMFNGNTEDPKRFEDYLKIKYPTHGYWIGKHLSEVTF